MALAETALGQIKALRQSATPHNYEIWYTYASGSDCALNRSINETVDQNGALSQADIDRISGAHGRSSAAADCADVAGAKVVDQIDHIGAMIDAALGSAANYGASLANVNDKLAASDREGLRTLVEHLVIATNQIKQANHELESRLTASKHEICELPKRFATRA